MGIPIKILVVEDNPYDGELTIRELRRAGYEPAWQRVDTEEAFLELLQGDLDIILCDYGMPQFSAPRALELLKASSLKIPFIIVSGTIGEDVAVEAMKQGAADYLLKDRLARLGPAVSHAMEQNRLRRLRNKAEEALRESEERLRLLIEGAKDYAIYMLALDGRIMTWNSGAERMMGYTAEEIVGRNYSTFYLPEDLSNNVPEQNLIETRKLGRFEDEGWRVRKDGSHFWANGVISLLEPQNEARGFCKIVRDLTSRRKLEDQLRQAQKMEAFGQLAGGIAHDFNNLLTVIDGYSNMLLESLPPFDRNRESVEFIQAAGNRAAALTRQLLAFSRTQVLEPKVLNLNEVVLDVEKMLKRLIGEDVVMANELDPSIYPVKADPGQVCQVIMNLAVNARDAMPQGGRLMIGTTNFNFSEDDNPVDLDLKPGRFAMLSIADTGEGMTPEVRSRIFEPFFTTKGVGKGTGLGLATVFGIVKQSGGHITVHSQPGAGTTFHIYIPAIDSGTLRPRVELDDASRYDGTETILLVEDEDTVRTITALLLQGRGYRVLQASSGQKAIEIIENHEGRIDLLLTDVVMPEMSGRQLIEALRLRSNQMRVLYMSGYTDDAIIRHGVLQAEHAFLQKPFSPLTLARKVREVLQQ